MAFNGILSEKMVVKLVYIKGRDFFTNKNKALSKK